MELRRYILNLADPTLLLLTLAVSTIVVALFLGLGLRLSSVKNVNIRKIVLASLASSVMTSVIVGVCAQATDSILILGILLSFLMTIAIIKTVLDIPLEKAFSVCVFAIMSQVLVVSSLNIAVKVTHKAGDVIKSSGQSAKEKVSKHKIKATIENSFVDMIHKKPAEVVFYETEKVITAAAVFLQDSDSPFTEIVAIRLVGARRSVLFREKMAWPRFKNMRIVNLSNRKFLFYYSYDCGNASCLGTGVVRSFVNNERYAMNDNYNYVDDRTNRKIQGPKNRPDIDRFLREMSAELNESP